MKSIHSTLQVSRYARKKNIFTKKKNRFSIGNIPTSQNQWMGEELENQTLLYQLIRTIASVKLEEPLKCGYLLSNVSNIYLVTFVRTRIAKI